MQETHSDLIEVADLTIAFGGEPVVDHISFRIPRGATVGIVGESGSGKSITALSIAGLLPATAEIQDGKIQYNATQGVISLLDLPEKAFQPLRGGEIAMVFQEPMTALNPVMRCGKQVVESLLIHTELNSSQARERTLELFKQVQLPDSERIFRAYPHQISGGQKQRVLIAMALCASPCLLIADEPTTALDVTVQKEVLLLLKTISEAMDLSVLFISHDLSVINAVADYILVMREGKIVEQGPAGALLANPQHPYTKGLLACRPPRSSMPYRLPTVESFLEDAGKPVSVFKPKKVTLKTKNIVEAKDISVWFSKEKNIFGKTLQHTKAVNGVSFEVGEGEILGLVGESGCGKTTLGRAVMGLVPVRSGRIFFEGQQILPAGANASSSWREHIQIVFQDPFDSLNPRIRVGEAIAEPLWIHKRVSQKKEAQDLVIAMLKQVGLPEDSFWRYPHQFSGGQRQRICIARALILKPSFIIFDESVSALDVSVQAQILNLILDLKEAFQFSCLFISHDLGVVRFISDRILVMYRGEIVEEGLPDQLFSRPQNTYTNRLIEAILPVPGEKG